MVRTPLAAVLAAGTAVAATLVAVSGPAAAQTPPPSVDAVAQADAVVAARPPALRASRHDTFRRHQVVQSQGLTYAAYDRDYKGVPVVGGDLVVVTDATGATRYTSVAQNSPIGELSTVPKVSQSAAVETAKEQLTAVTSVETTRLVVVATEGRAATLAHETTVNGTGAEGVSRLTVQVDAVTGTVVGTEEHVTDATGTGNGGINGTVSLDTTQSGSTFSLKDPVTTNLSCQDASTRVTFSGPDNSWGNGNGTSKESGCVDAFYVAQKQKAMLSTWLGRNGQNGTGGAWPVRVGLNDQNAYYDGTQVQIGKNTAGRWITSLDVVGHEFGHGIDDKTPGGISKGGTSEFVADTFGAATEAFAANANDPADYQVGEEVNLVGSGPIRYMYNPSLAGDSNCYSSSIPGSEVHAAAGPGNHWFYLLAQGSGGNGQPASTTCNGSSVTGLGIQTAIKIMYNAMLMKTSSSSYAKYRIWTLQAAKNLFPGSCTQFNAVKAAWTAVSLPAQSGEPTC